MIDIGEVFDRMDTINMNIVVYVSEREIGGMFQEVPELYPEDWTIGIQGLGYNYVSNFENCIRFILTSFPQAEIHIRNFERQHS